MNDKRALRIACKQRRKALSPQARAEKSRQITHQAEQLLEALLPLHSLALYDPMPEEADIRTLFPWCKAKHITTVLPWVGEAASPLLFRQWQPGEALLPHQKLPFFQPAEIAPLLLPDVILVPVIGFNTEGGRIGQGGGYYDRTLAALRQQGHHCLAVGVAFSCQQVEVPFQEAHDEKLDYLLTENQRFDFTK